MQGASARRDQGREEALTSPPIPLPSEQEGACPLICARCWSARDNRAKRAVEEALKDLSAILESSGLDIEISFDGAPAIPEHDGAVEREARLRTVPSDELANRVVVCSLARRQTSGCSGRAVLACSRSGSTPSTNGSNRLKLL